ncbi:MAG: hypothetical protein KF760_07995 [Candidatus Eremiobacteraeota bacterium]|nr:hypothetical protein [Candidatus Eremiobacteraeota bacterium]MCW5867991.1 hypothetical protein [Candidatus Eremiobacteraeota bacterium]
MRWLVFLAALSWGVAQAYEAPQIWVLDGASLAYSRAQIEQVLGPPRADRPLKMTIGGETWEYTYANGLKADFRDQDRGRHAMVLVGRQVTSRGLPLCQAGIGRAHFIEVMGGPPLAQNDGQVVYYDEGRQAYLTGYFVDGKAREFVLSRFRIDKVGGPGGRVSSPWHIKWGGVSSRPWRPAVRSGAAWKECSAVSPSIRGGLVFSITTAIRPPSLCLPT